MHGTGLSDGDDGGRHISQEQKLHREVVESRSGWKGLCRKGISLLIVLVATVLNLIAGTDLSAMQ